MEYTVDYFIEKFSAIPDELWYRGYLTEPSPNMGSDKHCVLGHCKMEAYSRPTEEALALLKLFGGTYSPTESPIKWAQVYEINDGIAYDSPYTNYKTPKERILHALYDIRDGKYIPHKTT